MNGYWFLDDLVGRIPGNITIKDQTEMLCILETLQECNVRKPREGKDCKGVVETVNHSMRGMEGATFQLPAGRSIFLLQDVPGDG